MLKDARVFAREFTVYNYDRRGRGDSGDTQPYAMQREIDDIEALIDAAGGEAYLYGHSSGAVLALEASLRLSDKVTKVVMYDPSYVNNESEKADYDDMCQKIYALLKGGKNKEAMSSFLSGIGIPKVYVFLMQLMSCWKTMVALAPTLAYDISLTRDLPPLERAARSTTPTQIVVGEKSPVGIHDVAAQLMKAIPRAKLVHLSGQDHMVDPKTLLPLMARFMKQS